MSLEERIDVDPLQIDVSRNDEAIVIVLEGELDVSIAPMLQHVLLEAAQSGANRVLCDVEKLQYLDSTGISVFVSAQKRLRLGERDLVLVRPNERFVRLLGVTGLSSYFIIEGDSDA